jgi:hypothetical protein
LPEERYRAIAASQIALLERLVLTDSLDVVQRVEVCSPARILLREPNLVPPEQLPAQERSVVRREHELCALGIQVRVVEGADDLPQEGRVEAGAEFVHHG